MPEIRFYNLQSQSVEQALPSLLRKALEGGHKILVRGQDSKQITHLDKHLWTFHPESFLPHGTDKDSHADRQPILLSTRTEKLNNAGVRIELGDIDIENPGDEALICLMFEDWDEQRKSNARKAWKHLKENAGTFDLSYWQQSESSGWEKKG